MQVNSIEIPSLTGLFKQIKRIITEAPIPSSPSATSNSLNSKQIKLLHHPFAMRNGMEDIQVPTLGTVTTTVKPKSWHINSYGTVHGGYTATMSDSAMAAAAQTLASSGEAAVSAEISQRYLKPINSGDKLSVTAMVLGPKTPITTVGSVVKNQNGEIVSISAGRFTYEPIETSNKSSTIDTDTQTWTAIQPGGNIEQCKFSAINIQAKDYDFSKRIEELIEGKNISISYQPSCGEELDVIEIKSEDGAKPIMIELNADDADLDEELEKIFQTINFAGTSNIVLDELPTKEKSQRARLIFGKMQECFKAVA